jgi:hypothetical protein
MNENEPVDEALARADRVLRLNGVRLFILSGVETIGIWSDLDGPHLREALALFHPDGMPPIRYLDGPGIPMRYKVRVPPGQPVPLNVVAVMQRLSAGKPWEARERMLAEIQWIPKRRVLV